MFFDDPLDKRFTDEEKEEYRLLKKEWKSYHTALEFLNAIRERLTDDWKHDMKEQVKKKKRDIEQDVHIPDRHEQYQILMSPVKTSASASPERDGGQNIRAQTEPDFPQKSKP